MKGYLVTTTLAFLLFFCGMNLLAQEAAKEAKAEFEPLYLTATKMHWNMNHEDGSKADWKKIEGAYFDNVTLKNEYIVGHGAFTHRFTADNTEVIFVTVYKSWEDIMKAGDKSAELEAAAWPDEEKRDSLMTAIGHYYQKHHSDELYITLPNAMPVGEMPEDGLLYYVRVNELAFPDDGDNKEIRQMQEEFAQNVIHKNPVIKGYYVHRHLWGADSRDHIEVFAVSELGDLDTMFDKTQELIEAHWPDEEKREEFMKKRDKYFTGVHKDYIYRNIPMLRK